MQWQKTKTHWQTTALGDCWPIHRFDAVFVFTLDCNNRIYCYCTKDDLVQQPSGWEVTDSWGASIMMNVDLGHRCSRTVRQHGSEFVGPCTRSCLKIDFLHALCLAKVLVEFAAWQVKVTARQRAPNREIVCKQCLHTFSAFWLWSSVVSVLISVTTDMSPTGDLLVTLIFAWGDVLLSLLGDSRVLHWHRT